MSPVRWQVFIPIALVTAVLAVGALRLGVQQAALTETDVIEAYAARYLDEAGPGAKTTDCHAEPGSAPKIWITLICNGADGEYRFEINRLGGLVDVKSPALMMPEA